MKNKKIDYDVEYGLDQKQVYKYGKLLLDDICKKYDCFLNDMDFCWELERDLIELNKLITTITRLQLNTKLVITDLKLKEEMEKQIQLLNNRDLGGGRSSHSSCIRYKYQKLSPLNRGDKSVVDKINERRYKNDKFKSRKRRVKTNS